MKLARPLPTGYLPALYLSAILLLVLVACSSAGGRQALTTTAEVDLPRFMGRWWVIAHIPYFAEKGKVATADIYTLRDDGRIDNVFAYRKAFGEPEQQMRGVASVVPGTRNAQWVVRFYGGLVKADYLVLEVAPDYSWALIGHPSRDYAWLFAREQAMDDAEYAQLIGRFAQYGYDTKRLQRVPQLPPVDP